MLVRGRVIQVIFVAVYVGGLVFSAGRKDYTNYSNWKAISGFMFFAIMSSFMTSASPVVMNFPAERQILLKEEGSKMYSLGAYFLSRNLVELPFTLLFPLLFSLVVYWMVGLASTPGQFFMFFFCNFLVFLSGTSLGMLMGSLIKEVKSAGGIMGVVVLPVVLFSGFYKNRNNLPVWIGWLEYISPLKYGFSAAT